MKEILYFYLPDCPHCRNANAMLDKLMQDNPAYSGVQIKRVDESAEKALADTYDYYYVPCFWVDGKKLHEGVPNLDAVKRVLDAAIS